MWLKQRVMRNQECDASNVFKGHRYFPFLSVNVCTCFCLSIGFCLFVICCFFQKDPMAFSITKKRNNIIFFKCQNDKISFQHWKDTRTHARQITKCTLQSWYQMSLARKQNMPDQISEEEKSSIHSITNYNKQRVHAIRPKQILEFHSRNVQKKRL